MANSVKDNTVYAVEIEVTEGTYVAPSAADTSYVQVLSDGAEMTPAKELLEREIFTGSIGKVTPRVGMKSVTGALPTEMRASDVEGDAPENDALMRSALGLRRQVTSTTADDLDAGSPHTASRIYLLDADGSKYSVGDCVTVKVAGDYHTSPVSAVSSAAGDSYIDLLVPADAAFSDGDVIMAVTTYVTANSGHPTLSVSKYIEAARLEQATGCRVNSLSLENFSTGQLASFNFGFEGLSFDQSLTAQPHTPDYDDSLPPIILNACVYQDSTNIQVNELAFSMENTLGFVTSTCSPNGKISGRVTSRTITGSFNPYKQDDDVSNFDKFNNNTEFSLFASAHNPSATAGEFSQVVAVYMPKCLSTEITEADQDGVLQEGISFQASRGSDGTNEELYISFS
jgi:hypothetical protein